MEQRVQPEGWSWKTAPGRGGELLYETGNWGDLLKAAWVTRTAAWLAKHFGPRSFIYADPFAGAPDYDLGPRVRTRLRAVGDALLHRLCAGFLDAGRWPSAATLVAATCKEVPADNLRVGEEREAGRRALQRCGRFRMLPPQLDGWGALAHPLVSEASLVLLDPYDFLREWRRRLPTVLALAQRGTVLVYIYNRAARSRERLRDYRDFRNALEAGRRGSGQYLARVPADAFLPNAHHELLLLPGGPVTADPDWNTLTDELAEAALRVAAAIDRWRTVEWR